MTTTKTFKAKFTRQGKDWLVELVDEPRVHSFGRTLAKARAMITDAAALWYELDTDQVLITGPVFFGGEDLDEVMHEAVKARRLGDDARREETEKVALAVDELSRAGVSLRDIADVLGMSYQRVDQIRRASTKTA